MARTFSPVFLRRSAGLSLVELLISLAIVSLLLTATMVAIDASFQAYAAAAESATTQTATRLVTHRLLTLLRTSTAHGPLEEDLTDLDWPVTLNGDTLETKYLELIDAKGNNLRIEYRDSVNALWLIMVPADGSSTVTQPLLTGVSQATFHATRRTDSSGVLVLERASIDLTVEPDSDNTLAIESANTPPARVVASTMPRRLN